MILRTTFDLENLNPRVPPLISDLQMDIEIGGRLSVLPQACVEDVPTQDNLTNRVNNWLNQSPIAKTVSNKI